MKKKHNIPEYGVSEFNKLISDTLSSNFSYVKIRGEISEINTAAKGQLYITIKDENSILSSVIWKSKIQLLSIEPEIGMEIIAVGKITTWSRFKTTYQLDIDNLELAGEGALLKLIEERKKKLLSKGLFDKKYKKKLPYLPKKIGVITSPTGSVIHDIINRIRERFPVNIDLWPTPVQGNEAALKIISAINGFNNHTYCEQPEVIIIARGGGSFEDLMAFNDEKLAHAVFNSEIPIISAIGHETDTPIIDFVSDFRAPTPTAAAEKVIPVRNELIIQVNNWEDRLLNSIHNKFHYAFDLFNNFSRLLKDPKNFLNNYIEKFTTIKKELHSHIKLLIDKKNNELKYNCLKLSLPNELINIRKIQSQKIIKNLDQQIVNKIKIKKISFNNVIRLLGSNSIDKNLKKGFVLLKKTKDIIKRANQLKREDNVQIRFFDKQVNVNIKKIN